MKTPIKTQSKSIAFIMAVSFFALSCAAANARADADDWRQPLTKIVFYGDLNIDSDQGAKVLYARLRSAAKQVCFPLESRDLIRNLWQRCFDGALASAVGKVNTARVTALHKQTVNHFPAG
jgi:UrcA family protein